MISIKYLEGKKFEISNQKEILIINTEKFTPVEMFVAGMGNCSLVDVIELAKKENFDIKAELEVEFKRKETLPKIFTEIHLIYKLSTPANKEKVKKWVLDSLESYCSTINTVKNTTEIYYSIIYNDETIAFKEFVKKEINSNDCEDGYCGCCNI